MQKLFALAESLGVQIIYTDLTHLNRDGDYDNTTKTIRLHQNMSYRLERSVLAHELAHAQYHDTPAAHHNAKQERQANETAATFLFTTDEYRQAAQKYPGNALWIAQELDTIESIVTAYEDTLCRIGRATYQNARLGTHQYQHRHGER